MVLRLPDSWSNWNLEMLVFEERGKPEYPEKNLSEQGREPTTKSTHIWRRRRDLNTGLHWWEASAFTTVPPLLPNMRKWHFTLYSYVPCDYSMYLDFFTCFSSLNCGDESSKEAAADVADLKLLTHSVVLLIYYQGLVLNLVPWQFPCLGIP